jgi:hypothetical protein
LIRSSQCACRQGKGKNRNDYAQQFKAAWERFAADKANLSEFLNAKRKLR